MSEEAWFRPKRYGYGATPTNWKGWAFTFDMVALFVAIRLLLLPSYPVAFVSLLVVWLAVLLVVVNGKCSSPLRWRWGQSGHEEKR
jgi:hypothetical protein